MSDDRLTKDRQDEARLLHAAARERLSVAAADLSLPDRLRLSEWQRTTVSDMLAKLIRTIEDELRSTLADSLAVQENQALHAAICSAHVAIAGPILVRSSAQPDGQLVSALVRRSEEHRRFRARASGDGLLLLELIADEDEALAEQSMAILIAQSRRFDRFSEPVAARTELAADQQHRLVWRVAAALRQYMLDQHEFVPAEADHLIVAAAERLLAAYDESDSLEARCMRLARRLHETGRLCDQLTERALAEGPLPLFTAALAVRTKLSFASAWEVLSDPRGRGLVFLLKGANIARAPAASILLAMGGTEEAIAAQADLFDATDSTFAEESLRLWQINPGYREAITEVSP